VSAMPDPPRAARRRWAPARRALAASPGRLGRVAAALAAAGALAACPLPQPLPSVNVPGGATVTPPRVIPESVVPGETVVLVGESCSPAAVFAVSARIVADRTDASVEARWFLNYAPDLTNSGLLRPPDTIPPPEDEAATEREVTRFDFIPVFDALHPVHVLELVVAYGFAADGGTGATPNRTPSPGNEIQAFRWVFRPDPAGRCN
jgi:hypothetical protein